MRSNPLHRKYFRPLLGILLFALALRALVPVGFMPMVGADGGFTLALCPGAQQTARAGDNPHAHHGHHPAADLAGAAQAGVHHDHGGNDTGSDNAPSTGQHQVPCSFAATATQAPAPEVVAIALAVPHVLQIRAAEAAGLFFPAILRAQSARAPPTLI